jgi:hypothetical protein
MIAYHSVDEENQINLLSYKIAWKGHFLKLIF